MTAAMLRMCLWMDRCSFPSALLLSVSGLLVLLICDSARENAAKES